MALGMGPPAWLISGASSVGIEPGLAQLIEEGAVRPENQPRVALVALRQ